MKKLITLSFISLLTLSSFALAGTRFTFTPAPDGRTTEIQVSISKSVTSDGSFTISQLHNNFYWTLFVTSSGKNYSCVVMLTDASKAAFYSSVHGIISSRDNARSLQYFVTISNTSGVCESLRFDEFNT